MRSHLIYGTLAVGALALLANAVPAGAHHAFGAEFDADAPLQLRGTIVKLEWVNPHSWIHIEVEEADGTKVVWMVEGGTPNVLVRRGLRRECLPIGTEIIVDGLQAKDHTLKQANGRDVTFADGRKFFVGSSGTGAPDDAAAGRANRAEVGRC